MVNQLLSLMLVESKLLYNGGKKDQTLDGVGLFHASVAKPLIFAIFRCMSQHFHSVVFYEPKIGSLHLQ